MSQKYADIIIDISHEAIDRTFQYIIPDELLPHIEIGMLVVVPFGKGNSTRKGYVINITDKATFDCSKMKSIIEIADKGIQIESKLIKLAACIYNKYGSTMINALKTVMPVKEKIRKTAQKVSVQPFDIKNAPVLALTDEQNALIDEFSNDINNAIYKSYLLFGVTGSGKTEVYIGCIKKVIEQGKQAIVLVPEIGLTYQNVARFKQYFGERVAVVNSRQSKGEKFSEFERVKNHEADIIIGPRSALFAPCDNLGLIIIDEEHDYAYKSDQSPKYHARDVARWRAKLENASLILGSATPSLESYTFAQNGVYKLWRLSKRPDGRSMPCVSIVDLRQELRMGNRSIISKELYDKMKECLDNNEQIMLFINKRGYNSFVSCRECGEVIKCPKCDVSLSLHNNGYMMCHYCGYIERAHKECPKCKSKLIGGFGTGTQKVENEILKIFPGVKTLRMDKDTTLKKGAQSEIINKFIRREADVLIGTQMIVKGHDFDNVTLVGIILADMSLYQGDYKAGERTFDLLTQAAGRAGRGSKPGNVVIQTYQPENYSIVAASKQQYDDFYNMEMAYRRLLRYPPVFDMLLILMTSDNYDILFEESKKIHSDIQDICRKKDDIKRNPVIGPSDASIARINDIYRRVIYIKTIDDDIKHQIKNYVENYSNTKVAVAMDINTDNIY